jgi:mitochondrial fission protein ELM1
MRTQARGLARAVADEVVEKVVDVAWPWSWFRAGWPGVLNGAHAREGGPLEPPWPDLVVSCGRRSAILGIAVKSAAGGRPVLVHVQDPLTDPARFDLVVPMEHDRARGPNVLRVLTTVHDLTPERLAAGAAAWAPRFASLGKPLIGVLLGGPTRGSEFGAGEAHLLLERLAAYRQALGGGLAIVPSRRTPDAALAVFRQAADETLWVWDRTGDNPYVGLLALADRLVVTGDSVSMVSEALATRAQVEVFASGLRKRHEGFIQDLVDRGLVRIFDGQATDAAPRPIVDATREAAERLKPLLSK